MPSVLQTISGSRSEGIAHRLARVCLPGSLAGRTQVAAGLPTWLTVLMGILSFALSAELIAYVFSVARNFLQVIYDQWEQAFQIPASAPWVFLEVAAKHVRPHVFAGLADGAESLVVLLGGLLFAASLLESINLVMLAPLAASYGQPLRRVSRKTRRILLSLGGLWLLEYSLLWVVLFLAAGTVELYFAKTLRVRISYLTLDQMIHLGFGLLLVLMLLIWLVRLMWAASHLNTAPHAPPAQRCSHCGYLLRGLVAGSNCPDCGQANPDEPDQARQPSRWRQRRQMGRLRTLASVSSEILRRPRTFFARLQVLCDHREALRFVRWNLWLCVCAWILAVPGIASAMMDPSEFAVTSDILSASFMAGLVALALALAGTLLLGLLISLTGFAIGVMREEPSWPIAAEAGCYLSAWLPRIATGQALWVTVLFTIEQLMERGMFLRLSQHAWINTGIPWEIVLSLIFSLPTLIGLVLMVRAAVICYRQVRYACR